MTTLQDSKKKLIELTQEKKVLDDRWAQILKNYPEVAQVIIAKQDLAERWQDTIDESKDLALKIYHADPSSKKIEEFWGISQITKFSIVGDAITKLDSFRQYLLNKADYDSLSDLNKSISLSAPKLAKIQETYDKMTEFPFTVKETLSVSFKNKDWESTYETPDESGS